MAGAGRTRDGMRVGVGVGGDPSDEQLIQARQMGCSGVVVATPAIPWRGGWAYDDLARLRARIESFDLRLEAIQHTPLDEFDQICLGSAGRDAALAHYQDTVRNLGRAGIPMLAYNWRPNRLYRTGEARGRGGVRVTAFDLEQAADLPLSHGRRYGAEELWATHDYFLHRILPVAGSGVDSLPLRVLPVGPLPLPGPTVLVQLR